MTAPVVRNNAIAQLAEMQHLAVPIVRGQWPAVRENDRLPRTPILVVNLCSVLRRNRSPGVSLLSVMQMQGDIMPDWEKIYENFSARTASDYSHGMEHVIGQLKAPLVAFVRRGMRVEISAAAHLHNYGNPYSHLNLRKVGIFPCRHRVAC